MAKKKPAAASGPKAKKVPISKLVPFDRNPRVHPEEQVEQIANSIQTFGFLVPILVDEKMNVLAGHGRLMAANRIGLTEVPVVVASHLTDAQKRAYVIADNKIAQNAAWDTALLKELSVELDAEEFDLELVGFNVDEIEAITIGTKTRSEQKREKKTDDGEEQVTCPNCKHQFTLVD